LGGIGVVFVAGGRGGVFGGAHGGWWWGRLVTLRIWVICRLRIRDMRLTNMKSRRESGCRTEDKKLRNVAVLMLVVLRAESCRYRGEGSSRMIDARATGVSSGS